MKEIVILGSMILSALAMVSAILVIAIIYVTNNPLGRAMNPNMIHLECFEMPTEKIDEDNILTISKQWGCRRK